MRRYSVPVFIDGKRVGEQAVAQPIRLWRVVDGPVGIKTLIVFPRVTSLTGTADRLELTMTFNGPILFSFGRERLAFILWPLHVKGSLGVRPPFFRIRRID